ncbi:MAG TPA: chorismate synthase [Blastocatellia bacterium]|jgi:chorismate synthase|nr:chorismate synthase [Blastocatellia bacterium]HAF25609.1 chorismate synthase [Blastocatellia bacterium]
MFRFTTAGESHGRALVAILEGMPAGVPIDAAGIDRELARRQRGYGRGGRMKIEQDSADILSGVRHGLTLGSPIAVMIENKDWANWTDVMAVESRELAPEKSRRLKRPRPGHADLAGGQKFGARDLRNILERASARETAARVACGALAKQLLATFGVEIGSHVIQLGGIPERPLEVSWEDITGIADDAPLRCADARLQQQMIKLIDEKREAGDTLGGIFEVVARCVIPGLGSHTAWDLKLDGRLAQAIMSIPAVKAVSIGAGTEASSLPGSEIHDEIAYNNETKEFIRETNRAGGLEGGVTNGEEIRIRGHLKPLSTLRRPLRSVDIDTKQEESAAFERSDITAVPAAGVIGEAMVALTIASAMREKFGGDSLGEMKRNFEGYREQLRGY